jgi:hypothetical protein
VYKESTHVSLHFIPTVKKGSSALAHPPVTASPTVFASDSDGHVLPGELRNVGRWQGVLGRLESGKFKHEDVVDYLQNKEHKALVFTQRRLLYINLKRQTLRWSFSFSNLAAVSTSGGKHILTVLFGR